MSAQNSPLDGAILKKLGDTGQTLAATEQDVRGRHVYDRDGHELGKVEDLLIDDVENRVRLLVVASGGVLGVGKERVFVPVEAVSRIDADAVVVAHGRDQVAGDDTRYDPGLVPIPREHVSSLYAHYGYAPFWEAGHIPAPSPPRRD